MQDIPQIHLINLDRRSADRLQLFKERNPHIQDFVRVSAVDGAKVDRAELIRSGMISENLPYGAGGLARALSHVRLWEMALAQFEALRCLRTRSSLRTV